MMRIFDRHNRSKKNRKQKRAVDQCSRSKLVKNNISILHQRYSNVVQKNVFFFFFFFFFFIFYFNNKIA